MGVLINQNEAFKKAADLKNKGNNIIFTNGCFDLLHIGHIRLLKKAKSYGGILFVAVNSDETIKRRKGEMRPIIPEQERVEIISSLECVDFAFIFYDDIPLELIKIIKPDIYVKGPGYKISEIPEIDVVQEYHGKVVILPHLAVKSTTSLIDMIIKKQVQIK